MERYERALVLHRLLKTTRDPVSTARMMDELGCGRATVLRDLAFLRDALGAPLVSADGAHNYDVVAGARFELPGLWLERALIDASDTRLLDSPLGWAGRRVLCTMWFAAGTPIAPAHRDSLLDSARELSAAHELRTMAGATATHAGVVVLRVLSARVEPAMNLLTQVWARWREQAWGLPACAPRVWRT